MYLFELISSGLINNDRNGIIVATCRLYYGSESMKSFYEVSVQALAKIELAEGAQYLGPCLIWAVYRQHSSRTESLTKSVFHLYTPVL